jgi:hypothetical protein
MTRHGYMGMDIHIAAWTATTHTFIGPRTLIPSIYGKTKVSRSDECRLLYLAEPNVHQRLPLCAWPPHGESLFFDTDIEVQVHANCSGRHCLQTESWQWDVGDKKVSLADYGYLATDSRLDTNETMHKPLAEPLDPDGQPPPESESLSATATRFIFGWWRSAGYAANEKAIQTHS